MVTRTKPEKATTKTAAKAVANREDINLDDITVDSEVQQRVITINPDTVLHYAELIEDGHEFPPLTIFRDPEGKNWLADGWHRLKAFTKAGKKTAPCVIVEGTREDARFFAATDANRDHPLQMTRADKWKAVETVIDMRPDWSERKIASAVGVSPPFVGKVKTKLADPDQPGANVATSPSEQQVDAAIEVCRQNSRDPVELDKAARELSKLAKTSIKAAQRPPTFYTATADLAASTAPAKMPVSVPLPVDQPA